MRRFCCFSLLAGVVLVATSLVAVADDLAPPLYRGQPNSVMAKFDLFGAQVPGPPVQFSTGANSTYPLDGTPPFVGAPGPGALVYPIDLPNFIDPLPLKKIRLQYSWFEGPTVPGIVNAINISPTPPGAVTLIHSSLPTNVSGNIFHRWDDYEIRPNPDWEHFEIEFLNADPRWVIIDTISIPEPASVVLLALASMLAISRRRR